jgi:hypothetical protein
MWKEDYMAYQQQPYNEQRRTEIQTAKRILDRQVQRLNERMRDLKNAENWLKKVETGGDEFMKLDQSPDLDFAEDLLMK